jgi:hypothetical protein
MADDAFRYTDPPLPPPPPKIFSEGEDAEHANPVAPSDVTLPLIDTNSVTVNVMAPPPEPPATYVVPLQ